MKPWKPLLLAASVLPLAVSGAHADQFVRMVSGLSGGSWYPLGAKIMQVMDEEIDGITTSNTSGGGISNILSVNGGDAEVGFSYAHTAANGLNARGKFNKPQKNIRHLATLYGSMFQVAVRKDSPIKSFEDMKAANISPGKAKWTGTAFAEAILKEYGITFDSILRNILRQDPDIIMVGEIRDLETAENAIQAALTGHLVLSTLHTNDAVSAITRLIDLGVEPFLINATLIGVVAQRLVRIICPHCIESFALGQDELHSLGLSFEHEGQVELKRGKGCINCRQTGYQGRIGIFEMFTITENVRKLIGNQTSVEAITKVARQEGMSTLRENAIRTMFKGVTTYSEVLRVTSEF